MKMEHTVAAPVDGVLAELNVGAGDQVDTGQVLAVVAEADPEGKEAPS
jgi:biotin carboxyl carrier protein